MPVPKLIATAVLTAANMAMTALRTTEGPRLTDTRATVADYGTPSNYLVGTRLVSAHCIFAKPIREERKKRKGKGGKQVEYTGYGTFMVQVAAHPCTNILQVYLDNHLIYDATGSGEVIYPLGEDYDFTAQMRFMLGGEAQEPDPDMLAYIEARDGPGTCPAYREQTNIYFQDLPLQNFANRRPDVKVLVENSRESGLTIPDTADITFVGQQQTYRLGAASGAINFNLSGGVASAPASGDVVLIVVSSGQPPFDSDAFHSSIAGYQPLTDLYNASNILADFQWRAYYKFMGPVPDTSFTPNAVPDTNATNGFQVIVLRGVDEDLLATEIGRISGVVPTGTAAYTEFHPADIVVDGHAIDPGRVGASTVSRVHYVYDSFALRSNTGRALPMVLGGRCTGHGGAITDNPGNLLSIYHFATPAHSSTRFTRSIAILGREVLVAGGETLKTVLTIAARRGGLKDDEFDFSQALQPIPGYNWTQGTGRQICEHLCDLHDVDLRPHDFVLQALPRGSTPASALPSSGFVAAEQGPYKLTPEADEDLPRIVSLAYADLTGGHEPNVAQPVGGPDRDGSGSAEELSIDMTTLALAPDTAQALVERWLRRRRFARLSAEFALPRRSLMLEPGDVQMIEFDGAAITMRLSKATHGADGAIATEWVRDEPRLAVLPGSAGAPMAGWIPPAMPTSVDSLGGVMDAPLLIDAHDQSAPLAYLYGGPSEPGVWMGLDFAMSDTGELDSYEEGWDGIASGDGAMIGTCAAALSEALPWVLDTGSSLTVTFNHGQLVAATLEELLIDPARNLAAVQSGEAWELVQFLTPTLTGEREYTIAGFLRGVRGTEHAIAGHAPGDRFVLLDGAIKRRTLGASEIGDTDWYVASTTGQAVDQDEAFSLTFTAASHRPYAAVHPTLEQDGADWLFHAVRRTRIGGATLDGQDVPLGQASEAWELDILDDGDVVRTISGVSLPLTWTEAEQIADFGSAQSSVNARLYQVDPTLNLRGYPLALAA